MLHRLHDNGFLSARPVRAATQGGQYVLLDALVSIRATRAGRDLASASATACMPRFYPRDPCGPRPLMAAASCSTQSFLSARPVRAATSHFRHGWRAGHVSIRATRAGRDALSYMHELIGERFYPRDPCGPRPPTRCLTRPSGYCFYPRDPCGPRQHHYYSQDFRPRFYPRDPCGPRHSIATAGPGRCEVSIRATRAGRDY